MAIAIKSIPVLKNESAKNFEKRAERNSKKRATVNFTEQAKYAFAILEKAKLR